MASDSSHGLMHKSGAGGHILGHVLIYCFVYVIDSFCLVCSVFITCSQLVTKVPDVLYADSKYSNQSKLMAID